MTRPLLVVLLLSVIGMPGRAQQAPADVPGEGQPAASAARTTLVRLDAVVTDRRGRPILDLKAGDFELRAGGVAQAIDGIEFRHASAPSTDPVPRTLALFLDEFHVAPGAHTQRARETLLRFVDEQIRPLDRVIVMKPLDSQLKIEFAADRAAVRSAVEHFEGRLGDYTPRTPFEQNYLGHAPAAVETARRQIVTAAIRALVTRIGEAGAGRSAVAIVSEGFTGGAGRSDRERRLPDAQSIVRAASRFNVAIYAFDPSEVAAPAADDAAARIGNFRTLSSDTGGELATGDQLPAALTRMSRDLDAYYLLTFKPSQSSDGRYQRIELTTRRIDAVVRARTGFWTPLPLPALTRADTMPPPMRALRRSPHIQSWYGLTRMADGTMRLRITWVPAPRPANAKQKAPASVVVRAARRQGATLFEGPIARVDAPMPANGSQVAEFVVPSGRVELDLAVLAADGSRIDQEMRDIEVPEPRLLRPTSLLPEIVRAGSAREFRTMSLDPQAAPTPARQFRRADRLLVRVPAIAGDGTRLAVSARMMNRWGQPMRELPVLPLSNDAIVQFDCPLGWLAAGDYEIGITVKGGSADTMHRISIKVTG